MKIIYLECNMGAAGDMLMAALLELYDSPRQFLDQMNNLGIPGVKLTLKHVERSGISGSSVKVLVNGEEEECVDVVPGIQSSDICEHKHMHHNNHTSPVEIRTLISSLKVSKNVKKDAIAVYELLAQAESKAHNKPVGDIHFHEVGSKDAVADIVGCCLLMEALAPEVVLASPINVGSGHVKCAHGILPVPAPATAILLESIPIYKNEIIGELCTPTGAALLRYFVKNFVTKPKISIDKIGNGVGQKEFTAVNFLRAYLGETVD